MMHEMMNESMMQGMGWGMMIICVVIALLFLALLVLAVMALSKYLRTKD